MIKLITEVSILRTFDREYKLMAVSRFKESGKPVAKVARELDIRVLILCMAGLISWLNTLMMHFLAAEAAN